MTEQFVHGMACLEGNFILPVAGYMQVIRRRTLTKWSNIHLEAVGESVDDVVDLLDSGRTAKLLSILSGRRIAVPIFERQRKKRQHVGWKNVCSFLARQEFPEGVIGKNPPAFFSQINFNFLLHNRQRKIVKSKMYITQDSMFSNNPFDQNHNFLSLPLVRYLPLFRISVPS